VILALVAGALALAGCGGSDSGDDASTQTVEGDQGTTSGAQSSGGANSSKEKASGGGDKAGSSAGGGQSEGPAKAKLVKNFKVVPVKVSGGGSASVTVKGGDNSIQEFGEEADESELAEAAEVLHSFYVAVSQDDWPTACSYLAEEIKSVLEKYNSRSSGQTDACEESLDGLFRARPAEVRSAFTKVDAVSLRRDGDQAFLLYHGSEYDTGGSYGKGDLYSMTMHLEDGGWKVVSVAGNQMGVPKSLVGR
jgi:hypothetical protein